jgi:Cys-rich protein (TIGR01571 family)
MEGETQSKLGRSYAFTCLCCWNPLSRIYSRSVVREKYLLKGGCCTDTLKVVFCPTCSINQEYVEVVEDKHKKTHSGPAKQTMS